MVDINLPIARLRRISAALQAGETVEAGEAAWFVAALQRYENEAATGMKLDRAMGLVPAPGQDGWWTIEARQRRDDAIRRLRDEHYADLGVCEAAREIAMRGRRFQASAWLLDKDKPAAEVSDSARRLLVEALATGLKFPRERQIENILTV